MPDSRRRATSAGAGFTDRWGLVVVAGLLSFVAMLDMSVVTVALADISADLRVSAGAAQWVVLGYQLAVVAVLLPVGAWLDGAGTRPVLTTSVVVFGSCSVLSSLAPDLTVLVAARVVQGLAAAAIFVLMPVLAMRSVRPEYRGRAMSVPATLGPLGAVLGPAIGGLLIDHVGWQVIFLIKVPVCVAAIVLGRTAPTGPVPPPTARQATDAALAATAVAGVLVALTFHAPLALLTLPAALLWLRRNPIPTPRPNSAVLLVAAGFAAMHYTVAVHLQTAEQVSATATGLTVLAFPAGMALCGPLGGRLADRYGAKPVAITGAAITALGLALLLLSDFSPVDLAWRMALAGAGMGLYGGPTQALVLSRAPDRMAAASATTQLARSLGFAVGPAVAVALPGTSGLVFAALAALIAVAALATT